MIRRIILVLIFLSCLVPAATFSQDTVAVKQSCYLAVNSGIYSCLDLWATTGFVDLKFQALKLWVLHPVAGAQVSFSGACMVYGGLTWPATPVKWLVIQTTAAVGYYENGEGIDMGFPVEFRLSLALQYQFRNLCRLGVEFAHISNANLSTHNPGTESVSVILQIPLCKRK
jgi:hypothetical protein